MNEEDRLEEESERLQKEYEKRRSERLRGGATDEEINQAYKERKILEQQDPRTDEEFLKKRAEEGPDAGEVAKGVGFEIAAGLATDIATKPLLALPPLYALANFVSGAAANLIAQKLRGETKLSLGEILGSGAVGIIPGSQIETGKTLSRIVGEAASRQRVFLSGAAQGIGSEAIRIGIDEQRLLTAKEAAFAGGTGGLVSQGFMEILNARKPALDYINRVLTKNVGPTSAPEGFGLGSVGAAKRIDKGSGDPEGIRSLKYQEGNILANTPAKNVKLLKELGLTDDESVFLLSNYYKEGSVTSTTITRDQAAAIESLYTTVEEFDKTKDLALPYFLRGMKGITRERTPQLDHIAQLKAALPFFNNAKVSQFPEITKIILEEGVFGLGHQRGNFKYLEFDVHTVKSNYFEDIVGNNGEIFFKDRDISTPEKLRAAAKEFAAIINNSNNVVADAIEQYKFMNKTEISQAELDEFVNILSEQPTRRKYSIKQVKKIFEQMEEDGFMQTSKESLKTEQAEVRSEIKEAQAKAQQQERLAKDAASVQRRVEQLSSAPTDEFANPFSLNMKDETLRELAEKAYEETQEYKLTLGPQQRKLEIFETEDREAWIKRYMRRTLDKIKRELKKNKKKK
tara:strand:+ start:32 stop:1915 length:1884 start_codon:yes stop_codon:yes gene_type:complete